MGKADGRVYTVSQSTMKAQHFPDSPENVSGADRGRAVVGGTRTDNVPEASGDGVPSVSGEAIFFVRREWISWTWADRRFTWVDTAALNSSFASSFTPQCRQDICPSCWFRLLPWERMALQRIKYKYKTWQDRVMEPNADNSWEDNVMELVLWYTRQDKLTQTKGYADHIYTR